LDCFLFRRSGFRGSLGPRNVFRSNRKWIPPLQYGRELSFEPSMLDAVSFWNRTLRRLFLKVSLWQHGERFGLIGALHALIGLLLDGDRIAVGRPRDNAYEMPTLLEFNLIEPCESYS